MIRKEHDEVYTRWGNTDAYKEHTNKTKDYTKEKWDEINNGLMAIFEEFAKFMKRSESLKNSQILVVKLKNYITGNYYTCTNEILAGLGHMYFFDERFKENIDKYGEGTAKFINKSIELYVKERKD